MPIFQSVTPQRFADVFVAKPFFQLGCDICKRRLQFDEVRDLSTLAQDADMYFFHKEGLEFAHFFDGDSADRGAASAGWRKRGTEHICNRHPDMRQEA